MSRQIRESSEYRKHFEKLRDSAVLNQLKNVIQDLRTVSDPWSYGEGKHGSKERVRDLPNGYRLGFRVRSTEIILIFLMDVNKHDKFYRDFNKRAGN